MISERAVPQFVHLYEGTIPSEVDTRGLATFLQKEVPSATIEVRENFLRYWLVKSGEQEDGLPVIAKNLARARIHSPEMCELDNEPLSGEIDFELRFLRSGGEKPSGILYDGYRLMTIYSELIVSEEVVHDHCHLVLTNQLFGTWDQNDRRYHARASVYGFPSLISTSGLVEGPARPRDFYLARRLGADKASVGMAPDERYLECGDSRLQEAMKGCLLQALFYHVTGDPFCENRNCRLFNAHWQEDLIHAQVGPKAGLCEHHRGMLEKLTCV